jgi:hypothetical protein
MREDFEVLSAVLDGDAVNIGLLESALEDPEGRRTFVDFVNLRQTAATDTAAPPREFSERALKELKVSRRIRARALPFPVAAAAILVAMLLGSLMNFDSVRQERSAAPPEPARVLRFEPGVDWMP